MIHLALQDLRHDAAASAFHVLAIGILVFAFLLLIPLSLALGRVGEAEDLHRNLIIVEHDVLQPEESRIAPDLAPRVTALLGDRLSRLDAVIFRILRVEGHPIQLRGADEASWPTTFGLRLLEGTWPSDDSEVVLGLLAAREGGWRTGSEINVYGRTFRVAGVAEGAGTQAQTIWMSYAAAGALFGKEKEAQMLVAHLEATADPLAAKEDLEAGFRSAGAGYDAYFEDAMLREYGAALNDLRSLSLVILIIAVSAIILGSHNLAWLAAEERRRLLGVLRAVGFDRRAVGRYLLFRAGLICVGSYLLALVAAMLFIRFGAGTNHLAIGGAQAALDLSPGLIVLGLFLAGAASLTGTWLSARQVLRASAASLLGRGPGSSFA